MLQVSKSALTLLLYLSLIITAQSQNILYNAPSDIYQIERDLSGVIHLNMEKSICAFNGNDANHPCISIDLSEVKFLPIDYSTYIICSENKIEFIKEGRKIFTDTLPELITSLVRHSNNIYIGTSGSGLYKFDSSNSTLTSIVAFSDEFINDLHYQNGQIWVAVDDGLHLFNPTHQADISQIKVDAIIVKLCQFNSTEVLGAGAFGELFVFNRAGLVKDNIVLKNQQCKKLSYSKGQAALLTNEKCYLIHQDLSLTKLAEGSFNDLLFENQNIYLARGRDLLNIDMVERERISSLHNLSLFAENDSSLWVGSKGEIRHYIYDSLSLTAKIPTKVHDIFVSAIYVLDNRILVGTMGDGLFILDKRGKILEHYFLEDENNKNNIIQIVDNDPYIWIAYLNGAVCLKKNDLTLVKEYGNLLATNYLYCLLPISHEEFYIGTSSNGVLHYKDGQISQLLDKTSVYSLAQYGNRVIAGTETNGIYLIEPEGQSRIISQLELPLGLHVTNHTLLACSAHEQWLIDLESQYLAPTLYHHTSSLHINSNSSTDRYLYLGYKDFVQKIDRKRLPLFQPPEVKLLKVSAFDKTLDKDQPVLSYDLNNLTFYYHSVNYNQTDAIIYKYRMVGIDSTWQYSQQDQLSFYNLEPGKYTLEIAAGTFRDFEPRKKLTYSFIISKPIWQEWWFLTLILLGTVMILLFVAQQREAYIRRKEEIEKSKIKFDFEQLKNQIDPHFLFNSLNSLMGIIEESPKEATKALGGLSEVYQNVLKYQKVDLIPLQEELKIAHQYFLIHQLRYDDLIDIDAQVPESISGKLVPLSCQFLIENAIKHNVINKHKKLHIQISVEDDYLVVRNNINRRNTTISSTKIGLSNLTRRYEHLSSNPVLVEDNGNDFTVKLPIIHD